MRGTWIGYLIAAAALFAGVPTHAQVAQDTPLVRSERPDAIGVTVYREPGRTSGEVDLDYLNGFALITETRTVDLPAGRATVRFEGVAEGMVAVSAVVTGLSGGVVQKNRDADLLGPKSLLDGTLGNRVSVRRTNVATGAVSVDDAVIRSGSGGAVVLQTKNGFEALRCSGLSEGLVYDRLPAGLVPVPVLSVDTASDAAQRVTVTLTYLATGFDWAANYVAEIDESGERLNLFAWLTVANSNPESFAEASMQAVAGKLSQVSDYRTLAPPPENQSVSMRCWPIGSGRNGLPQQVFQNEDYRSRAYAPAYAPPPPMALPAPSAESIVVTGSRIAKQEELGDLKLYRVPIKVTIAANAQKQVALVSKDSVAFERLIKADLSALDEGPGNGTAVLRLQNTARDGLGVPLPSGGVALYRSVGDARLLTGRGDMRDRAVGEEVDIPIGDAPGVTILSAETERGRFTVTVSNANTVPRTVEVGLVYGGSDDDLSRFSARLIRKDGKRVWVVTVPANATRELTYRYRNPNE